MSWNSTAIPGSHMIRLKMCGMRTPEDVRLCAQAGPDALGLIFADGPRRVTLDEGTYCANAFPDGVRRVGVFADQPRDLIRAAIERCRLDLLQFAGDEPAEFCGSFGLPTLIVVRERAPVPAALVTARAAAVLMDASSNGRRGGSGVRVDPVLARLMRDACAVPFILAGGLTPENVADAIATVQPDGVDVRSGIESHGHPSGERAHAFASAVKESLRGHS